MTEDVEEIVQNIRACIVSNKGPIPLRNLARDYETLCVEQIPYRKLNFATLEEFLRSLPSLRVSGSGGQALVEAATSGASKHISDLISKQKTVKKPASRGSYHTSASYRGRGARGRGRGSYSTRGYYNGSSSYSTRDQSTKSFNQTSSYSSYDSKDYSSRDYNSKDYSSGDYTSKDYSSRDYSSKDYSSREQESWDYSPQNNYNKENKGYQPNRNVEEDTSWDDNVSKKASLPAQIRQTPQTSASFTVKVDGENRKVMWKNENKLPPRFQKLKEKALSPEPQKALTPEPPSSPPASQNFDANLLLGQTDSATENRIISPLGPSQLIAAGRAKQQAEHAQNQMLTTNLLLQPSTPVSNGLAADFGRLTHQEPATPLLDTSSQNSVNKQMMAGGDADSEELLKSDESCLSNNVAKLHSYCAIRGWQEPLYKVTRCPGTHLESYFASVNVFGGGANSFKVSTLPFDHKDINIVKGFASKKALDLILAEESKKVKHDVVVSSDKILICNRIGEIVAGAQTGMYANYVKDEYINRYEEHLPSDWLRTVIASPSLTVENIATVNSNPIIFPRETVPQLPQYETPVVPPTLSVDTLGNNPDQAEDVFITHATSVNNVYFRVIGKEYSDEYEVLLQNMDKYYNGVGKQDLALVLEKDHYYAAYKSNTWFRVCVTEVDQVGKLVTAWLLDLGDTDSFPFGSLYRLDPQFCQLPQQAVLCTLEDLEAFYDDPLANKIVTNSEMLIGQTLIAKISHKDAEYNYVSVSLFDTSGDEDVNVNLRLKDEIIAENKPVLPAENCVTEVAIAHVSKKGEVYVTFIGPALERIVEVLDSLSSEQISQHKLTSFKHIAFNKFYLAKFSEDDKWYRAVVTNTPSVQQNKIPVRFVDYGNSEVVSINCLADLETFPPILRKLAPQAIKVSLHKLPLSSLTNPEVARLHSLLGEEEKTVLIKTMSLKEDPPAVEIFIKGGDPDNPALQSVNSAIELYRTTYRAEEGTDGNYNQLTKSISDFGLTKVPEINLYEILDLIVVLPAHPGHFIFQLGKYAKELTMLKTNMNTYYKDESLPELTMATVQKNKLYAARYSDNLWYRVQVRDQVAGNRVFVRLIDFGDVACVFVSSLRELPFEFRDCPFLAIKGRLANVKPAHQDWSVEDCIRFSDLVVGPLLGGTVINIEEGKESPMDMTVTLVLVNKDSGDNQNIADVFLSEQRAVKV